VNRHTTFASPDLLGFEHLERLLERAVQSVPDGKTFLHRGIAARQFLRSFVLADGIEVTAAALEKGLLKIDLARRPIQPGVRTVEIMTGGLS
jgi:HSP20 family molecular chaperone IbpA